MGRMALPKQKTDNNEIEPSSFNPGRATTVIADPVLPTKAAVSTQKTSNDPGRDPFIK